MRIKTALIALGCILALGACGGEPSAEDVLNNAQAALEDARNKVLEAGERLKEREEVLETAKADVEDAREQVRTAQAGLVNIESKVDLKATDGLLFRAIQSRLLEDDALEGTAIRVQVEKGMVTLLGEVSNGELKERALELARAVPGVASVDSQITVSVAAEAPPEE